MNRSAYQCWLCNKEYDVPDDAFAHLDRDHGGVITAIANRINSLVKTQEELKVALQVLLTCAEALHRDGKFGWALMDMRGRTEAMRLLGLS